MSSSPLLQLLHVLLLLLPAPLRDHFQRPNAGKLDVYDHPLVLFAGFNCPDLEARLTEAYTPSLPRCGELRGKGWFPIYSFNAFDLLGHDYVPCFMEQMALVYDPVLNDYRNIPGVETRVPNFGSPYGFVEKNRVPDRENLCLNSLRKALEAVGYRDGETLFGAPYDMRYAPPSNGYTARVQELVEQASSKNGDKPVILVGHSFGATVVLNFLNSTPLPWRKKFIKHFILMSPVAPGFTQTIATLAAGPSFFPVDTVSPMELRAMYMTFATSFLNMPSPVVFGHKPLVITKHRNYSAYQMEDLLLDLGFAPDQTVRQANAELNFNVEAPLVPTTYMIGEGVKTPEQLVFWEGNFDLAPDNIVYGNGDGSVNSASMLAYGKELGRQQKRNNVHFKSLCIANATHSSIVTEEDLLSKVMAEILQANRP